MLSKLKIKNVALISSLELDFCNKLNILSGETGAGKSIIVDSLMLLLGARYDKSLLSYGADFGFVEGVFESTPACENILSELGFDVEEIVIVNRKFYADGKNEIRINGRTSTISMLKQITAVLVDIYGQNEYQTLSKQSEHLRLLDFFVRHGAQVSKNQLGETYKKYKDVLKQLAELGDVSERERNINLLRYQVDEIIDAKVKACEEDELLQKRQMAAASEKISAALNAVTAMLLEDDEANAQSLTSVALRALGGITAYSEAYDKLYERLSSLTIELEDIADTARGEAENLNFDFDDMERLEKRLELIRSLKRKYGDFDKMQKFKEESEAQLFKLENCDELFEKLSREKVALIKELYEVSVKLHGVRAAGAIEFAKLLVRELADLGMNNSEFEVRLMPLPTIEECEEFLTANGMDSAEFYLSTNIGQPLKPLIKIISGGEMSRFMLALKVISSRIDDIPTMIFDEIDAGISGKIGQEVAKKLAVISRHHQILCVTHLSQIASMADNHYFIEKTVLDNKTFTKVNRLSESEIVEEISRLSGAKDISSQSNLNAKQMKDWSDEFKKKLDSQPAL